MPFPYQCLVARIESSSKWTLFGASGSKLIVQSSNGVTSVWPEQNGQVAGNQDNETEERPGKRVKLSPAAENKSNFATLVLSNNQQYLVGVTGEDKCIRVFQVDSQGQLQQLSERCMSRKPSSITLTAYDSTILCADKFGDVYSLPLLPSPDEEKVEEVAPVEEQPEAKDFTPSANVFTVHSGRNRRTLEEQLKQKAKGPAKTKEVITFKHELLLGHVSMLTDIVQTRVENRNYIITADRDEHIRISRGIPQAHIIEGFCFGHEEFVSKLCLTPSGLLVSGGGDADLFVWDWQKYSLLEKLPLRETALQFVKSQPALGTGIDESSFKVAVTGIWSIPNVNGKGEEILVACEGLPALFSFTLRAGAQSGNAVALLGNALDVAFVQNSSAGYTAVVSVDNVHKPGSVTELREAESASRLQYFSPVEGQWHEDKHTETAIGWLAKQGDELSRGIASAAETEAAGGNGGAGLGLAGDKALRDILYHVENLRKRPGAEE